MTPLGADGKPGPFLRASDAGLPTTKRKAKDGKEWTFDPFIVSKGGKIVGVNGYGVIGKRVADAVWLQADMQLVGVCDLADGPAVTHYVNDAANALGGIDVLVGCAGGDIGARGTSGPNGGMPDPNDAVFISYADLKAVLDRNRYASSAYSVLAHVMEEQRRFAEALEFAAARRLRR